MREATVAKGLRYKGFVVLSRSATTSPLSSPLVKVVFGVVQPQPHLHRVALTTPVEDVLHGSQLLGGHKRLSEDGQRNMAVRLRCEKYFNHYNGVLCSETGGFPE